MIVTCLPPPAAVVQRPRQCIDHSRTRLFQYRRTRGPWKSAQSTTLTRLFFPPKTKNCFGFSFPFAFDSLGILLRPKARKKRRWRKTKRNRCLNVSGRSSRRRRKKEEEQQLSTWCFVCISKQARCRYWWTGPFGQTPKANKMFYDITHLTRRHQTKQYFNVSRNAK